MRNQENVLFFCFPEEESIYSKTGNKTSQIMNKSILKVVLSAAVVAVAGYGMYENQLKENLSDVMLENVEALGAIEGYEPGNECSGCVLNSLYICKMLSDTTGCFGDPYLHYS